MTRAALVDERFAGVYHGGRPVCVEGAKVRYPIVIESGSASAAWGVVVPDLPGWGAPRRSQRPGRPDRRLCGRGLQGLGPDVVPPDDAVAIANLDLAIRGFISAWWPTERHARAVAPAEPPHGGRRARQGDAQTADCGRANTRPRRTRSPRRDRRCPGAAASSPSGPDACRDGARPAPSLAELAGMIRMPSCAHIRPNCVRGSACVSRSASVGGRTYTFFQSV